MQGSKWHNEYQYFGYIWHFIRTPLIKLWFHRFDNLKEFIKSSLSSEWTTNKENIKKNGQLKSKSQNAHLARFVFFWEGAKKKSLLWSIFKKHFLTFLFKTSDWPSILQKSALSFKVASYIIVCLCVFHDFTQCSENFKKFEWEKLALSSLREWASTSIFAYSTRTQPYMSNMTLAHPTRYFNNRMVSDVENFDIYYYTGWFV